MSATLAVVAVALLLAVVLAWRVDRVLREARDAAREVEAPGRGSGVRLAPSPRRRPYYGRGYVRPWRGIRSR